MRPPDCCRLRDGSVVPVTRLVTSSGHFDPGYGFHGTSGLDIGTSIYAKTISRNGSVIHCWGVDLYNRIARYRIRRFPTFLIGGRERYTGWDVDEVSRRIERRLVQR